MDEEYKAKKSQLRNAQAQELKKIEKEFKKTKGNRREALQGAIEETEKRHEKELEDLAKECGIAVPKKRNTVQQQTYYFPDRKWKDLGKKELEREAEKRGLGKSGNREELLTKLILFHTDQTKKVEDGIIDKNNVYCDKREINKAVESEDSGDEESVESEEKTKGVNNSGAANNRKKTDVPNRDVKREVEDSDENSEEESSGSNDDIPDALQEKGRTGDARGAQKREAHKKHPRGKGDHRNKNKKQEPEKVLTEEERQAKREAVMAQVLVKLLEKKPEGVLVENIGREMQKLNVSNFRPELLGYESTEEWIQNQGPSILFYDTRLKKIMPGRRHLPFQD